MSLNIVTLMGRLVRDPDKKVTPSGVSVCNFTIAVDRDYKNGDERVADFVDCVAWRGTADFIERNFTKGRMILVSGSLQSKKWQDREGNNRTGWEVIVQNVYFCDSKKGDGTDHAAPGGAEQTAGPAPNITEDYGGNDGDLPF